MSYHPTGSAPYTVRTAVFEGPLDLLLQLITRRQVEITKISLADLVTEYLSFLDEMRRLDLEATSEFVLIAATLIQLKARHLLPDDVETDLDEELALMEERDRLLARLLQCVTFKDVAAVLSRRLEDGSRRHGRVPAVGDLPSPPAREVLLPVDAAGLAAVAGRVLAERATEVDLDHLDLELPSVQQAIDDLRRRLTEEAETGFGEVVAHCTRPVEVAAYFLALLELARWGLVEVAQEDWLAEIRIRLSGNPAHTDPLGGGSW
jgi:segregation and condensation protein A